MKTVCKKLLSLTLVAMLLVSAVPFQVFADEGTAAETTSVTETTVAAVETTAAPAVMNETEAPTTEAPTTEAPTTEAPTTEAPTTEAPTTEAPTTEAPTTEAPTTEAPTTEATVGSSSTTVTDKTTDTGVNNSKPVYTIYLWNDIGLTGYTTHRVQIGERYDALKELPVPTREHYIFAGWKLISLNTPVKNSTKVESNAALYATWTPKKYPVHVQSFDTTMGEWVTVKELEIDALNSVSSINGLPTNASMALKGYTIAGWMTLNGKDFTPGVTKVTNEMWLRPRYQKDITLKVINPSTGTSSVSGTFAVEIGKAIGKMPHPGARDEYAFDYWYASGNTEALTTRGDLTSTVKYNPAKHGDVFFAKYVDGIRIMLHIYTNRSGINTAASIVEYTAPATDVFYTSSINMYDVFPSYTAYDDDTDKAYGWFDRTNWDRYCANRDYYEDLDEITSITTNAAGADYTHLYIMLVDSAVAGTSTNNSYNNNVSTADPSNPTTGDYIMIAVTVLAISGAALAVVFYMKKRKAAK